MSRVLEKKGPVVDYKRYGASLFIVIYSLVASAIKRSLTNMGHYNKECGISYENTLTIVKHNAAENLNIRDAGENSAFLEFDENKRNCMGVAAGNPDATPMPDWAKPFQSRLLFRIIPAFHPQPSNSHSAPD